MPPPLPSSAIHQWNSIFSFLQIAATPPLMLRNSIRVWIPRLSTGLEQVSPYFLVQGPHHIYFLNKYYWFLLLQKNGWKILVLSFYNQQQYVTKPFKKQVFLTVRVVRFFWKRPPRTWPALKEHFLIDPLSAVFQQWDASSKAFLYVSLLCVLLNSWITCGDLLL